MIAAARRVLRWPAGVGVLALAALAGGGASGCESTPVLLYHSVGEVHDPPRWVSSQAFRAQMQHLLDEGYTVLTAAEYEAIADGKAPRPRKPVVLTFDDGYANFYRSAFPVLQELGLRGTMFLISSRVRRDEGDRSRSPVDFLIWPEVQEMAAYGIDFESHSVTHPHLRGLPAARVREEVVQSRAELEAELGRPVTIFAYPNGSEDGSARHLVEAAGYSAAYSVSSGMNGRFDRQRISVHADMTLGQFADALGGTWWGEASGTR